MKGQKNFLQNILEEGRSDRNIKNPYKRLVHLLVGIRAGWRHEPVGKRGITHFTEHLIFEGNEKYPQPDGLAGKYGVELNGMAGFENTLFFFTAHKDRWKEILKMFLSIIFYPSPDKRFDEIKHHEMLTAITDETDYTPWELAYEWAYNLVFQTDFRNSLGTKEEIAGLTYQDIKEWHSKYYHMQNAFLLLNGNVDEGEVLEILEEVSAPKDGDIPVVQSVQWEFTCREIELKTRNTEIVFGAKVDYHPGWEILISIIGSCLPIKKEWKEIFGEYTYTMEARVKNKMNDSGLFLYFGATSYKNAKKIEEILPEYLREMNLYQKEVEQAKRQTELRILNAVESGEKSLFEVLKIDPSLGYGSIEEFLGRLRRITTREINNLKEKLYESLRYKVILS